MLRGSSAVLACLVACASPAHRRVTGGPGAATTAADFDRDSLLRAARRATNLDIAEAQYRAILAHDPDDPVLDEFIRLQIDRDLVPDAVELAKAAYDRHHDAARARLYLDTLFAANDGERAVAIAKDLNDPAYSARALVTIGDHVEAAARLRELAVGHPENAKLHLWLAEALSKQADSARFTEREPIRGEAIEEAGRALHGDPTLLRAYMVLADELQRGFDFQHTKLILESLRSAAVVVRTATPWVRMVWVPTSREDKIAAMQRAVAIEPNRGDYWSLLAHLLRDDQPDRAREALEKAVSVTRPDVEAAEPLGPMLVMGNHLERARALADDIAKRSPTSEVPHLIRGAIAVRERKADVAIVELDRYLAASTNWRDEVQNASTCVRELTRDEPRDCPWFDADFLRARRGCDGGPKLATAPRRRIIGKRPATTDERNALATSTAKAARVVERGVMVRPSGERVAITTTRTVRGGDAMFEVAGTRYTLHDGHAFARAGVCKARELPRSEREVVEDMAWRVPELLAARIRDGANRVDVLDGGRFALTARSGASVTYHVTGSDIDELVYTDGSGTFSERLEDWRADATGRIRVPYRRRISIYGNEALVLDVESVTVDPPLDDATFAP